MLLSFSVLIFFKILVSYNDIFPVVVLKPLDDISIFDLFAAACTHFFVADAAMVILAELIKMDIIVPSAVYNPTGICTRPKDIAPLWDTAIKITSYAVCHRGAFFTRVGVSNI